MGKVKPTGNDVRKITGKGITVLMSGDLQAGAKITAFSCVICGPAKSCDCHTVTFGSDEYFARHGLAK